MHFPEHSSIVLARPFGFSGRREPHLSHLSTHITSAGPDDSIKSQKMWSETAVDRHLMHRDSPQSFQSAATSKQVLLSLMTQIVLQRMKGNPGSCNLKVFNMDYSTVSTPTSLFILCLHPCQRHPSPRSMKNQNKFSADVSINLPQGENTGNQREVAGLTFICHVCCLKLMGGNGSSAATR